MAAFMLGLIPRVDMECPEGERPHWTPALGHGSSGLGGRQVQGDAPGELGALLELARPVHLDRLHHRDGDGDDQGDDGQVPAGGGHEEPLLGDAQEPHGDDVRGHGPGREDAGDGARGLDRPPTLDGVDGHADRRDEQHQAPDDQGRVGDGVRVAVDALVQPDVHQDDVAAGGQAVRADDGEEDGVTDVGVDRVAFGGAPQGDTGQDEQDRSRGEGEDARCGRVVRVHGCS